MKSHKSAKRSYDYHEIQARPEATGRAGIMLIQNLTLRTSVVLDVPLRIACEHAEFVFGARFLQIVNPERSLAVNDVLLDHGFTAAGFPNHHVEVTDIFARRHVPRRFPTLIFDIAKEKYDLRSPKFFRKIYLQRKFNNAIHIYLKYCHVLVDISIFHIGRDIEFRLLLNLPFAAVHKILGYL